MEYYIFFVFIIIYLICYLNYRETFNTYYRIPFMKKNNNVHYFRNIIPKIVFQSFKTRDLPYSYRNNHKDLIKKNYNYVFFYYNDLDCDKFLKSYSKKVYSTYKILKKSSNNYIKGAGCSDLFRYCILEKYGGIWLDMGMEPLKSLDNIFNNIISDDRQQFISCMAANKTSVFQAIICCTKNHPFLKEIISEIVENVLINNQQLNTHVWRLTGPILLANIITKNKRSLIKTGYNNINGNKFYLFSEIILNKNTGLYRYYIKNTDLNEVIICSRCAHQKNGEIITKK